jgi:integrase
MPVSPFRTVFLLYETLNCRIPKNRSYVWPNYLDRLLETIKAGGRLALRSIERYEGQINNHIIPKLGTIPLQQLSALDLQRYYNALPLASSTKSGHHVVINSALNLAVANGYVLRNVAQMVQEKPKARERNAGAKENYWTASDARKFLDSLRDEPLQTRLFYTMALETGARRGELCGLKWEDFDPKAKEITIRRTLVKPGRTPVFGPTKNKEPRTLKLDPATVRMLERHRVQQNERKMANRKHYNDLGLIFAKDWAHMTRRNDVLGDPLQTNNIGEREFNPFVERAGVKRITFHGMRHTAATLALEAGYPAHAVQYMLGHKRIEETLDTYSHVTEKMKQEVASGLAAIYKTTKGG